MGLLIAFLAGYWMGTRAGADGMKTLVNAGNKVLRSEEFQSTVAGVTAMARGTLAQALDPNRGESGGLRIA